MYIQQVKSGHKTSEKTPNQHIKQQRKGNKKGRIDFGRQKMMEKEWSFTCFLAAAPPKVKNLMQMLLT